MVHSAETRSTHRLTVVIPVYRGELTLSNVVSELVDGYGEFTTPDGHSARLHEIILVHDNGPDGSARVIRELCDTHAVVRAVWLSRNFGQHPATLAGMAAAQGDWIVTMDEDGQQDPAALGAMLDTAMSQHADLVYAAPTNRPPHGFWRNFSSRGAKAVVDALAGSRHTSQFNSYRLLVADRGRALAAAAGPGVYLDVALGWVVNRIATCPVALREEGDRPSGYSYRTLFGHFWRMVLTSGTRLLRVVSLMGVAFAVLGVAVAGALVINKLFHQDIAPGWTSTMVLVLVTTGLLLMALGIVAEFLGIAVNRAMGRPLYLVTPDPLSNPLNRERSAAGSRPVTIPDQERR